MYTFGQKLIKDLHFYHHLWYKVPVQIYLNQVHEDIGFIQSYNEQYIRMNNTRYSRNDYVFLSRPGY